MKVSCSHILLLVAMITFIPFAGTPIMAAWSTNPSENTMVSGGLYNQDDPQIVSDGEGGSIIAWRHIRSIVGTETDIFVQRLDAEGNELWITNGTAVCTAGGNQIGPELVSDGDGGAVIIWIDYRTGSTEIYAQRVDSSGAMLWAADGIPVCTSGSLWGPDIASDGAGGAIIAWHDKRSGSEWDIYAQRIISSGAAVWTANGIPVCSAANDQLNPRVSSDGAGGAYFSWQDPRSGTDDDIYCQRIDASGNALWTANGVAACQLSGDQQHTVMAVDGSGGLYIGWRDHRSSDFDIYVQRLDSSGMALWTTEGFAVCTAVNNQENVVLEEDGTGGVYVAWNDERDGGENDIYAQHLDNSGAALWAADGIAVCTATNNQFEPQLAGDGYGGLLLVWEDFRSGSSYDIYAQRVDQWGILLWKVDGVAVSTANNNQLDPVMIADGNGGAFIAWDDDRSGSTYDVFAQRVDFNGRRAGAAWSIDSTENNPVCQALHFQYEHQAVSDGVGGVIAAWQDARSGVTSEIYAQRMDTRGSQLWTVDGVHLTSGSAAHYKPAMTSDGQGGAIIAWKDHRSGSGSDIYAQRVDASGIALWATHGVAVCTAAGNEDHLRLVSDGSGGVIIAWSDYRGADTDIYAQRLNASGTPLWTTNGVVACGASGTQYLPEAVTDGEGGAIIAWIDSGLESDVYAQRINFLGTALWTTNGVEVFTDSSLPQMVSDGAGGAIITCSVNNPDDDIVAQRISAYGTLSWSGYTVCQSTGQQLSPKLVSDGAGGAIIAWEDRRVGSFPDIYAQRVTATGFFHWAQDGVPVCTASSSQASLVLASDGHGGSIIAWKDYRSGGLYGQLYAQHMDSTGSRRWATNGIGICAGISGTTLPAVVSDDTDGVIAVWTDPRGGLDDIYAQRVDRHGLLGDPSPAMKSVIDHPGDQGGVTVVSWAPSPYDQYPYQVATHYSVWMRLPDRENRTDQGDQTFETLGDLERAGWVEVDNVTATHQDEYGYNAPAYEDWTGGPDFPLTEYKVIAHTSDPWVFWESDVRSGCSVDNLAPGAPLTLLGLPDEADVLLTWEASGYQDEDLVHYNVYRSNSPGFTPNQSTLIGTITDIEYTDPDPGYGTWYYRVAGEDVHGNVGTPSNETAVPLSTSTVAASLNCMPSSGVLPFTTGFTVQLTNQYNGQVRRIAGRINLSLAGGTYYTNWRAGFTNIAPDSTFVTNWNQALPALWPLVGDNVFQLVAEDVTPAPYNQPPYPPAGDTDSDTEVVTGIAP